jgi:hypothetical protein
MTRLLTLACLCASLLAAAEPAADPRIVRVYPLGGRQGASVTLEILGEHLSNATTVEFDCRDLIWTETKLASAGKLSGTVSIAPGAALGPHVLRARGLDGDSSSALFNVSQFASLLESEPNNAVSGAQAVPSLPIDIQGRMDGAADIDVYAIDVHAGERWAFDLRAIEYGSALEARMSLEDAGGKRVAFNDDRADFDDNPLIYYTFTRDGRYYVRLDQYRGPRGFNFGKNCAYILRISALPQISYASPPGVRAGAVSRVRLAGTALQSIKQIYLTELRRAEYARMTYPHTMTVHFRPDPPTAKEVARIEGKVVSRKPDSVEAEFHVPRDARPGLWRVWVVGPQGVLDGPIIDLAGNDEQVLDGALVGPAKVNEYRIEGRAGKPLHCFTLAEQLGLPHLDTVLELRDAAGKKLAENDDVVAGQGTLIGNPDSSLFYTPREDGPLFLRVRDRNARTGPSYQYRIKIREERPTFYLITTPENFNVPRGGVAQIKVHLIRDAGFEGEVEIWMEGLPTGIEAPRARFRADQLFEPNADGADMIIPELEFPIRAPEALAGGTYPIRVLGRAVDGRVVEAHTTLLMGPLLDLWNFIRRPDPQVTMTVYEPFAGKISASASSLHLNRGASMTLELKAENIPNSASFQVMNLPEGVTYRLLGREKDQVTIQLEASDKAVLGSAEISAEAVLAGRRAASPVFNLSISAPVSARR